MTLVSQPDWFVVSCAVMMSLASFGRSFPFQIIFQFARLLLCSLLNQLIDIGMISDIGSRYVCWAIFFVLTVRLTILSRKAF